MTLQIVQALTTALSCQCNTKLLNTEHTLVTKFRKNQAGNDLEVSLLLNIFIVMERVLQATWGEEKSE